MKNKYTYPEIVISDFEQENVLTVSDINTNISAKAAAMNGLKDSDFYKNNGYEVLDFFEF